MLHARNAVGAELLDHAGVDLDAADRVTYLLEQSFRYEYDAPVSALRHRLVVVPPRQHGDVHRRSHHLSISGADLRRRAATDGRGNTVVLVQADEVEQSVEFHVCAVVERVRGFGLPVLRASALSSSHWLGPTRLTAPDDALRAMASDAAHGVVRPLDVAERLSAATHDAMTYQPGATTVRTTAAEALAGGRGVCQDYAHIMLAMCHVVGLPARYVSGHLLGQGGTHAWVEVIVPAGDGAVAVPFDPCNGRTADNRYVTVATGRDYADVAPTSGTYQGQARGRLTSSRRVGVVSVAS
jgi:transglutaminase-like putative cysteine protease